MFINRCDQWPQIQWAWLKMQWRQARFRFSRNRKLIWHLIVHLCFLFTNRVSNRIQVTARRKFRSVRCKTWHTAHASHHSIKTHNTTQHNNWLPSNVSSVHKTQVYGKIIRELTLEQLEPVEQVFVTEAPPPLQTKLACKLKQQMQYNNCEKVSM